MDTKTQQETLRGAIVNLQLVIEKFETMLPGSTKGTEVFLEASTEFLKLVTETAKEIQDNPGVSVKDLLHIHERLSEEISADFARRAKKPACEKSNPVSNTPEDSFPIKQDVRDIQDAFNRIIERVQSARISKRFPPDSEAGSLSVAVSGLTPKIKFLIREIDRLRAAVNHKANEHNKQDARKSRQELQWIVENGLPLADFKIATLKFHEKDGAVHGRCFACEEMAEVGKYYMAARPHFTYVIMQTKEGYSLLCEGVGQSIQTLGKVNTVEAGKERAQRHYSATVAEFLALV